MYGTRKDALNGASGTAHQPTSQVAPRRGELGGNRTHDPRIKSALLYRLSYELNFYLIPKYHNEISRYVRELELRKE